MMETWVHIPVLLAEVLAVFDFKGRPARLIDGTLGNGGHTAALLEANPRLEILGIDRDTAALARAQARLAFAGDRFTAAHGNFSRLAEIAADHNWDQVDGVLLDIGVSSPQIDDPARGFSWRADGPLDMRMDRESELNASRILNRYPEAELVRIFREYGEIRQARKLARLIVEAREKAPFATTADLVAVSERALGRSRPGELPAPTLVFQALRIEVNDELGELERVLPAAQSLLAPGGRMAVISFHSLEDRIVKHFYRRAAAACVCPPGLPVCVCGKRQEMKILTGKALTASAAELAENRRAACARLRAAEKVMAE
ncbi:MAG: 16S rRNA (cytosine(1402)-N(4))-methyltransferase RsmH [Lentisphaeria bacterium]|nr:16S rRNA (cytosine(1402)-N(4))-methyltransferase RsmH [Lentisphaeria bacterium]